MEKNEKQDNDNSLSAKTTRTGSIGWKLKNLSVFLDKEMSRELKPFGLNFVQFTILMVLIENTGLTQVDIGKRVLLPGYATTRNLDLLEKADLIKRRAHETSRRSLRVHITEKGRMLAPELFLLVDRVNALFTSMLTKNETERFASLADKLLQGHRFRS